MLGTFSVLLQRAAEWQQQVRAEELSWSSPKDTTWALCCSPTASLVSGKFQEVFLNQNSKHKEKEQLERGKLPPTGSSQPELHWWHLRATENNSR